jgi:hypothetical protein
MSNLNFRQKWNSKSKAFEIIVETENEVNNRTLNYIKKLLKL